MKRNFTSAFLLLAGIAVTMGTLSARAAEVSAEVTYVAWRTLYLDAGSAHGIRSGASGLLYHESTLLGEIEIVAVAESTSVATLSSDSSTAHPGDRAVILIEIPTSADVPKIVQAPSTADAKSADLPVAKRRKQPRRFTGRASLQTDIYQNNSGTDINPGATLRSTITGIVASNSQFSLKYRGRQHTNSDDREWQHRLYEADLSFESEQQRWRASVGRIQASSVAGIGYLDGAYGEQELGRGLAVGAFGGAQAGVDLSLSDFSTTKGGILITHRRNETSARRSQMTVAMAGEYVDGNISREFVYQQVTVGLGNAFSLYESSDFNINRGWRREVEGSVLSLANVLANVRYSPLQTVTLSVGYDGRARYHDWETRETPDSLFDDAIRHGLRAGVELLFLRAARLSAQQSYRSDPTTDTFYPSGSYTLSSNALIHGAFGATLRFNTFSNPYSTGQLKSMSATWALVRNADLRAEYGQTHYDYRLTEYSSNSEWIRASFDLSLRRGTYMSLQAEQNSSVDETTIRTFIELGQRFR